MSSSFNSLIDGTGKLIKRIDNLEARQAFLDAYNDTAESLQSIQNFFIHFTTQRCSKKGMRIFFRNWRSPGLGSASFCALSFRILKLADQAQQADVKNLLYGCATRISEIACEDVGIGTINHQTLYEQFALEISGDDKWKQDKYYITGIKDFLTEARLYRQNGENITYGLILSLPEELYNYGEFTFIAPLFIHWHKNVLNMSSKNRKSDLKFIYDHLGNTESRHFSSVIRGFEDYCNAMGSKPDWTSVYQCNKNLIENMADYYKNLMCAIVENNF
jgi:hypothetical protein